MSKGKTPWNKYWTRENCLKSAFLCKTKKEWKKRFYGAYLSSLRNGWHNECCMHMEKLGSRQKKGVYAFEFSDNTVYVGITFNFNNRIKRHLSDKNSQVYRYILKTNLSPKFRILSEYIDKDIAVHKEQDYVNYYKINGWKLLNIAQTGGLGGNVIKWTRENCIADAKQYNNKTEWAKNSSRAYKISRKNGWFNECCSHMQRPVVWNKKWTIDICKKDALKYDSRTEWAKNSKCAYYGAVRNNWLDDCTNHMKI